MINVVVAVVVVVFGVMHCVFFDLPNNSCTLNEFRRLSFIDKPVCCLFVQLYPFPVAASLVSLPLTNSFSSSLYRAWIDDVGICVGSDGGGDIDVGGDDDEAVQCSSHEQ